MLIVRFVVLLVLCSTEIAFAWDQSGLVETPVGPPGTGKEETALATQHFHAGVQLFKVGKFALALKEFQISYDLSHMPDLLHNMSFANERIGQFSEAIALEERFLKSKRSELSSREIDEAEGRLARLRQQVAAERPIVTPSPSAAPPVTAPRRRPPTGAIVLIGLGGASLIGGITTGVLSLQTANTIEAGGEYFQSDYDALLSRHSQLSKTAISLNVVGGVLIAGGVTWAIVDRVKRK